MIGTDLRCTRLGPIDRPVLHSYYDVCPESPDAARAIVTVFESDAIPGPARIGIVNLDGELVDLIDEPIETIGHVGRFGLWVDNDRIAFRRGGEDPEVGWNLFNLATGRSSVHPSAVRQWHPGIGRGLAIALGETNNPHRLRQGIEVLDGDGRIIGKADVRDCMACKPADFPAPPVEQTDVKNYKWAPDGSRFFVVFNNEQYRKHVDADAPLFKTLVAFDPDCRNPVFLGGFSHHPSWSADGTEILAMECGAKGQDLVAIAADGSCAKRLVLRDAPGVHGSPAPDGRRMVIDVNHGDGTASLALYDMAGGKRADLARFTHRQWDHARGNHPHPTISPDGRRVYFNAQADGRCGCYVLELNS